ncbi:MAG: DUF1622 domain-containing protein [Clostridia bacterium]|nr:DUF1622 domain-containing protein [Clostridia bacterium]
MYESIEHIFTAIVQYSVLALEFIGVLIILFTAGKGVVNYIRNRSDVRLEIAQGIALALEFKLGSEVLRTTIVRDSQELLIVGAIVLLRAAITFLIHWEIKNEEARMEIHPK